MSKQTQYERFYFHVDSIEKENNETIIVGWVVYKKMPVQVSLRDCKDYDVDHIYRSDVESAFAADFAVYPECGFEIKARDLNQAKDKLIFSIKGKTLTTAIKETKDISGGVLHNFIHRKLHFLEAPLYMANKCLHPQSLVKGLTYLKAHGLKETYQSVANRQDRSLHNYMVWLEDHTPTAETLQKQRETDFPFKPLISIIVPVFNTPVDFLREMVQSVLAQSYEHWELCLADGSTNNVAFNLLEKFAAEDQRIKVKKLENNAGISGNTNAALAMAKGDYIALLDHDDLITPDALYENVRVINASKVRPGLLYSDEDKVNTDTSRFFDPAFKPDFSPYTLRNDNYICHFTLLNKAVLEKNQIRFSNEYNGAQDFDIILRVTEKSAYVAHIPKILYHWRAHRGSTASTNKEAKPYTHEAGKRAVRDHLARMGIRGQVVDGSKGELPNVYHVQYEVQGTPLVSIIIPSHNKKKYLEKCVKSIVKYTAYPNYEIVIVDNNSTTKEIFAYYEQLKQNQRVRIVTWAHPFNYAALNNFAVANCKGEYLVLMNNDVEIITESWLTELLGLCEQPDVGVVGAKLYYEDDTVQHAGIVVGICGVAGHCFKGRTRRDYGYALRLTAIQNLSAVTGALMITKKALYQEVGGMDEKLAVAFNDVDYCLKIRERGIYVIFDPYVEAYHFESVTRGSEETNDRRKAFANECKYFEERWGKDFIDPYYNINLSRTSGNFD